MSTAPTIAMPAGVGRLGIQLLLTAEVMLFAGLIASFTVLKSGNAAVVAADRKLLDAWLFPAVASLIIGSIALLGRRRSMVALGIAFSMAVAHIALMAVQWMSLEPSRTDVFYASYYLL